MSVIDTVVSESSVVVVVGSGGVGKTTTSALLAMHAAISGKRTVVMTIDPARRLANSLGVDGIDHEVQRLDLSAFEEFGVEVKGEMWATMLDMKSAFDGIVERTVENPKERDELLQNRFYQFFSTSLAGAQELSAAERLLEFAESGEWDLIVLDTPPTANALDFLEAPNRFFDALDNDTIRWFIAAGGKAAKRGGSWVSGSRGLIMRTLGRFTGAEFFSDLGGFFSHFSAVLLGFRDDAKRTQTLLRRPDTSFVIVTSPDPQTSKEAMFFRKRLADYEVRLAALVVNRVREFGAGGALARDNEALTDAMMQVEGADLIGRPIIERIAKHLRSNSDQLRALAERDSATVDELRALLPTDSQLVTVPMYATDVHSLLALERVRRDLTGREQLPPRVLRRLARHLA